MNVYEQVERNINELVENSVSWSACATPEEMQNAKEGKLTILWKIILVDKLKVDLLSMVILNASWKI